MVLGVGFDVEDLEDFGRTMDQSGDAFLNRVYTEREIEYCRSQPHARQSYAARYCAKEAAMKALGTGWNHGVRWRDCEVMRLPGGRPTITFHGKAAEVAARLGVKNAALSLSHTAEQAIAQVILES